MNPTRTTLREILATGQLGMLEAGMKRKMLAELVPEFYPPNGENLWVHCGIEIFLQEDTILGFKIAPLWHDFGFPPSLIVEGYIPTHETTFDEFCAYLEAENLQHSILWNGDREDRWPVIFIGDKVQIPFGENDLRIVGIYLSSDTGHEKALAIAANIRLNIYDLLKSQITQGQLLDKRKYKPASVQIFEPNDFYPDVSFLKNSERNIVGTVLKGVPRLAVIVVTPNMKIANLNWQISVYLSEGTKQVWLVYPETKEIHCHTPENVQIYRESHVINTEKLFPTIELLTANTIFHLPTTNNQ